jgi:hypothetical protein
LHRQFGVTRPRLACPNLDSGLSRLHDIRLTWTLLHSYNRSVDAPHYILGSALDNATRTPVPIAARLRDRAAPLSADEPRRPMAAAIGEFRRGTGQMTSFPTAARRVLDEQESLECRLRALLEVRPAVRAV